MRLTQFRIFSLLLTVLSLILLCVTFSTNQWYILEHVSSVTMQTTEYSYGLFYECSDEGCKPLQTSNGWRAVVIACIIVALASLFIATVCFILVIMMQKGARSISVFLLLAAISSCIAFVIYPLKMAVSEDGSMGYSYFIGCAGGVLSAGAGLFALAAKEERIAPSIEIFSNFSLDISNEVQR